MTTTEATPAFESSLWPRRIRAAFWIVGIVVAGVTAYTTRYFINGDAIVYVEMGESLRTGQWLRLANLTYSPGYPLLLGIGQILLNTNPFNELPMLRIVNFFCFLLAMCSCELIMHFVKRDVNGRTPDGLSPLPYSLISALCYSMFLVTSLVFVRLRLLNPDMLVLALTLAAVGIILRIREEPLGYLKYALLGSVTAAGYVVKSFFLPFSPVFLVLAGLCPGSWRKAVPRVGVTLVVMLILSAPLIGVLSNRLGRFTYGELGAHIYAMIISGKGSPLYPEVLNLSPKVSQYLFDVDCTRPSGFDICYWHEGLRPDLNIPAHLRIIPGNAAQVVTQTPWLLLIAAWYAALWKLGSARFKPWYPPSTVLILMVTALCGIALYCLVQMEPRYIASFLFLGFTALVVSLRYPSSDRKAARWTRMLSAFLTCFFVAIVVHSLVDQSMRGLYSTEEKPSYREAFEHHVAVKDFLLENGLQRGDFAAVVGGPPVYWARLAGLRITAEVNGAADFLGSGRQGREQAIRSLREAGIKAVIAKGQALEKLGPEGWIHVPGTRDYFVLFPAAWIGKDPGSGSKGQGKKRP
ncbi:MAG: hypothetical protein V1792_11495 [Pseudomonadota bacterium]